MRTLSVSEQSTRYCNYSKDKFGVEITYVIPSWATNLSPEYNDLECSGIDHNELVLLDSLKQGERHYMVMMRNGAKPQEARDVLPLATATTVMYTGFVSDWKHFFDLRAIGTTGKPHPQAFELANPLMEDFINRGLVKFDENGQLRVV